LAHIGRVSISRRAIADAKRAMMIAQ